MFHVCYCLKVLLLHCCYWWKAQKYVFKQDAETNGPDRAVCIFCCNNLQKENGYTFSGSSSASFFIKPRF